MKAQIQIQFPRPGQWDKMTMTTVYQDADGYIHTDRYTQDDIPADHAPALAEVVSALVGLAAPWQARQVLAKLDTILLSPDPLGADEGPPESMEAVILTVEAVSDEGGCQTFMSADYPDFVIANSAAVAFFTFFTGGKDE